MRINPGVTFTVPGFSQAIHPGTWLWDQPLAGNRRGPDTPANREDGSCRRGAAGVTVGDYLTAARRFLTRDQCRTVRKAVRIITGVDGMVCSLEISLEKHGAYYHPLRVRVETVPFARCSLVLNGAVTEPGGSLIMTEADLLARMVDRVTPAMIPRVFGRGMSPVGNNDRVGFLLAEWFEGFHEFHVTRTRGGDQVVIWGDADTRVPVPWSDAVNIYEAAAYVMGAYYDIHTGREIFPWHHAAGDFVTTMRRGERNSVKLITVRGTRVAGEGPRSAAPTGAALLISLLFFCLNLTVRMRLDRVDGTGRMVFLPEPVLDATLKGVFRALSDRSCGRVGTLPGALPVPRDLCASFVSFLGGLSREQLGEMTGALSDEWPGGDAVEKELIMAHLDSHCRRIQHIVKLDDHMIS